MISALNNKLIAAMNPIKPDKPIVNKKIPPVVEEIKLEPFVEMR